MAEKLYLWQELLKSTLKIWVEAGNNMKASVDGRFESLVNSGRSPTWAYKLKALMPSEIHPHG